MRTDDPRPRPAGSGRLREGAGRAWRRFAELGPRARVAASALGLAAVVALGYYTANPSGEATTTAWLFDGPGLAPEDARRALTALAVAKIPATSGPRGQIAVPAAKKTDALALLSKQKLLPTSLRQIRDDRAGESILWAGDRSERRDEDRQREVEIMVADLEGVEAADVRVHRASTRLPGQRVAKVAAIVRVQPIEGRPLSPQTIQAIQSILKSSEPDLPADALTILDRSGRPYLVAGNPEAGAAMMAHVREEALRAEITSALSWIDGLRVHVALDPPPAWTAAPPPSAAPSVVVNAPTQLDEPAPTPPPSQAPPGRARILIQVPISHFLHAYQTLHRREATLDDLKAYVPKVEETIRATVQNIVPAQEVSSLRIDRIDAPGPVPPPVSADAAPTIRIPTWLVPASAGAAVAVVALILVVSRWMITSKKPATIATVPVPRAHFGFDGDADASGPSGRVRDLVRRDPAAAAGVLGRWIGQGGPAT